MTRHHNHHDKQPTQGVATDTDEHGRYWDGYHWIDPWCEAFENDELPVIKQNLTTEQN